MMATPRRLPELAARCERGHTQALTEVLDRLGEPHTLLSAPRPLVARQRPTARPALATEATPCEGTDPDAYGRYDVP